MLHITQQRCFRVVINGNSLVKVRVIKSSLFVHLNVVQYSQQERWRATLYVDIRSSRPQSIQSLLNRKKYSAQKRDYPGRLDFFDGMNNVQAVLQESLWTEGQIKYTRDLSSRVVIIRYRRLTTFAAIEQLPE